MFDNKLPEIDSILLAHTTQRVLITKKVQDISGLPVIGNEAHMFFFFLS
jgi:hypothetical protein